MAPIRRIAILDSEWDQTRMKAARMTFPRRARRRALPGTAIGTAERSRPIRVGEQRVSAHRQARTDVRFGDASVAVAVSGLDFMGGRSGSSHVSHAGRHRAAHRAGIRGNSWWTLAAVSIGIVIVALGVAPGLHTTMTTAETAGIGAVLALIVWRVDRAGTFVPASPVRRPDVLLAAPAEADGLVGARSSRHREG
jgi:hypothetical protein